MRDKTTGRVAEDNTTVFVRREEARRRAEQEELGRRIEELQGRVRFIPQGRECSPKRALSGIHCCNVPKGTTPFSDGTINLAGSEPTESQVLRYLAELPKRDSFPGLKLICRLCPCASSVCHPGECRAMRILLFCEKASQPPGFIRKIALRFKIFR